MNHSPDHVFTKEEDAEMIDWIDGGGSVHALARRFGVGHQTIANRVTSLELGRAGRAPPASIPCMRCREVFASRDRRSNRLCEGCLKFADELSRSCVI